MIERPKGDTVLYTVLVCDDWPHKKAAWTPVPGLDCLSLADVVSTVHTLRVLSSGNLYTFCAAEDLCGTAVSLGKVLCKLS